MILATVFLLRCMSPQLADFVAKVFLPATSVTSLTLHLSAIAACLVFWREIYRPAFSDWRGERGLDAIGAGQRSRHAIVPSLGSPRTGEAHASHN
jgi:hypothetical protein